MASTLYPSADTYISQDNTTTNYGTATLFYIGSGGAGSGKRTLIKFDMSGYASVIYSAILKLRFWSTYAGTNTTLRVYRVLRDWGETTATWAKYDGTNAWGTAGATNATDIDLTEIGTYNLQNGDLFGYHNIVLNATEVEKMRNGTYPNYGFFIKADLENGTLLTIASREQANTDKDPILELSVSSASLSPSASQSPSSSVSPSSSESPSPSASPSPSSSESVSVSLSPSVSESRSPSVSESRSPSVSESRSPSVSPSVSVSLSPSVSESLSPSVSVSWSPSLSPSQSASASPSPSMGLTIDSIDPPFWLGNEY